MGSRKDRKEPAPADPTKHDPSPTTGRTIWDFGSAAVAYVFPNAGAGTRRLAQVAFWLVVLGAPVFAVWWFFVKAPPAPGSGPTVVSSVAIGSFSGSFYNAPVGSVQNITNNSTTVISGGPIPRSLSADDTAKMAAIMSKSSGFLRVVLPSEPVNDAYDYGQDFRKVIQRAGWKTDYSMPFASFGVSPHGLCLVVPNPSSLTPNQALVVAALKAVDLSFDVQAEPKRPSLPSAPAPAPDPDAPDAMLVISRKTD